MTLPSTYFIPTITVAIAIIDVPAISIKFAILDNTFSSKYVLVPPFLNHSLAELSHESACTYLLFFYFS